MIEALPVSRVQRNRYFCLPERDLKAVQQNGHHQKTTKSELHLPIGRLFLLQSSLPGPLSSYPIETHKSGGCDMGVCLFRVRLRVALLFCCLGFSFVCLGGWVVCSFK